jgi:hypothetical protein
MAVKLQPFEIPDSLGEAARRYLFAVRENPDNEEPELILLKPFSQCAVRDLNHRRLGWLFIFALRRVFLPWREDGYETSEPVGAINVSIKWLTAGIAPRNWDQVCRYSHPRRWGIPVYDCYAPMLSDIAAAAALTAQFARTAALPHAASALRCLRAAAAEAGAGYRQEFVEWLANVALPAAYNLRKLRSVDLFKYSDNPPT